MTRISLLKHIGFLFVNVLFLLALHNTACAQVKFSATCNEDRIAKNELVQIQFKIENASSLEGIHLPDFKNFQVVSGPSRETGYISYNGNASHYDAVTYLLKPKHAGTFTIPGATAIINGQKYKSNSVQITVTNNTAPQLNAPSNASPFSVMPDPEPTNALDDYILRPGEDATEKAKKNLKVKMVVDKTTCYVGEPIVVAFKLYTRLRSQTAIVSAPSFNGFSVSDLNVKDYAVEENLNGKPYNSYVLRKVQLYPLQPGKFVLEPLTSNSKVTFFKNDPTRNRLDDLFGEFMDDIPSSDNVIEKTVTLQTEPVSIEVKPLPKENVPESFKGAVGQFKIISSLQNDHISTDDAGNLIVTLSGAGNIQLINSPEINWPKGIDAYEPKVKEELNKQSVPISGSKTFTIPFTVSKAGDYSIPPIKFSWFDPESGTYKTSATEPIAFKVSQGNLKRSIASKKEANRDTLFSLGNIERTGGIILGGGIIVLALVFLFRKKSKESDLETQVKLDDLKSEQTNGQASFEIPQNPLAKVHEKLMEEDAEGYYKELETSLKKYLAIKLKVPAGELTKKRVMEELDRCNVSIGTANLLQTLMQEIELSLYAKHSHTSQMRNLYEKASQLVALLDKQICR